MRRRSLLHFPLAPALLVPVLAPTAGRAQSAGITAALAGRQALALAAAQRWPEAEAAAQPADPPIRKLVTWLRLQFRGSGATASEIIGFTLENPEWPAQDTLGRRVEEGLAADPDDGLALRWFAARTPRSLEGYQRLADALARAGKPDRATAILRAGWLDAPADPAGEPGYLERNAAALTPDLHAQRFDRLAVGRGGAGAAARLIPYLSPAQQGIAGARLDYAADRADADRPALAAAARGDAGLTLDRARWLRRRDRDAEAAAAWAALPEGTGQGTQQGPASSVEFDRAVWAERQLLARRLLRLDDAPGAYAVAARHGIAAAGEPRQEAEFLAGFLALRRLNDPAAAERHFARVGEGSRSVITNARSLYWQGRAAAIQGAPARARERYAAAARLPLAFYGQLAALALGEDGAALAARIAGVAPPQPTAAQLRAHEASDLTRVVLALAGIGESRRALTFLLRQEELGQDPAGKALAARLATRIGRPDYAVWVARRAGVSGLMLPAEGWPTPYGAAPLGPDSTPEPALILAVTRQESNFDPDAVSTANARGLMQLLPATAAAVARKLSLRHQIAMLTTDPVHNMRLGAGYLDQMLGRFGGALPLAVAAYNAGPARVDEWLGTMGDPRGGNPAMLDWLELIPFAETRNYVQRVIENVAIYRARDARAAAQEHPMARWLAA